LGGERAHKILVSASRGVEAAMDLERCNVVYVDRAAQQDMLVKRPSFEDSSVDEVAKASQTLNANLRILLDIFRESKSMNSTLGLQELCRLCNASILTSYGKLTGSQFTSAELARRA